MSDLEKVLDLGKVLGLDVEDLEVVSQEVMVVCPDPFRGT